MKRKRPWSAYPMRICMYLHHCAVCDRDIVAGQAYFDGGYGRRAHESCGSEKDREEGAPT